MKDIQFIYWLQGYLELSEPSELSEKVVKLIKSHLKLVLQNTDDTIEIPFIFWLDGYLSAIKDSGLDNKQLNQIVEKIHKVFKHIIDPQASDELQPIFNGIHGPGPGGELLRC